ncbi:MAG: hypothetical protein LJE91_08215 [Gammaproteobacteria bacterium]|jgi:aspartate carbamoyltransferase catalytic subunit|nr:hypothetical protein [Gammaproteobacteria bacterium]
MPASQLPPINPVRVSREHKVAEPGRAEALRDAIPAEPERLTELYRRHVVSARHFSPELMLQIFRLAAEYELGMHKGERPLRDFTLSILFLDQAHPRIRLSFERACLNLGASFLHVGKAAADMMSRHAALDEVAECCNTFGDLTVLRTPDAGTMVELLKYFRVPVISAGHGIDESPTNGLADLYTLFKWRPDLINPSIAPEDRIQIGIGGNPAESALIGSFLFALTKFPHAVTRVVILGHIYEPLTKIQREECRASGLRVDNGQDLYPDKGVIEMAHALVPKLALVYVHAVDETNVARRDFEEAMRDLQPDTMILNPGAQSEEFRENVNDSPFNAYFEQIRGALFIHMALMRSILVEKPLK